MESSICKNREHPHRLHQLQTEELREPNHHQRILTRVREFHLNEFTLQPINPTDTLVKNTYSKCTQYHRLITKKQVPHTKKESKKVDTRVGEREDGYPCCTGETLSEQSCTLRMQLTVHCVNFISTMKENSKKSDHPLSTLSHTL